MKSLLNEKRQVNWKPRPALFVCAAAVVLIWAGKSFGQGEEQAAGKKTYAASCAGCHGLDGKGGERAPDIATRPQVRQFSDAAILEVLQKGVPNTTMPAFSFLDVKTRKAVVAYLRTLQGATTEVNLPGDAQRGQELFFGKGGCSSCHMIQGQGGFFGSDLGKYAQGRSPEAVREAIVAPNRELEPRRRTIVATLANGTTLEGLARNEDNFSLQLLTPDGVIHLLPKNSLAKLSYLERSPMPADYGTKLSAAELDDLVKYLSSFAKEPKNNSKYDDGEEDE
ncbi:MAG: c-type cytochrome [Acidobacteria bacterium]|nr:c-type cytochrome [Acidobacteriota bacterium]MBS1864675.1 c-type cytochrome [Acidobacteriota bacterium]